METNISTLTIFQIQNGHNESNSDIISIYARIANVRKINSKMCFVILRQKMETIQCICLKKTVGDELFGIISSIASETIVIMSGRLSTLPESVPLIKSCTCQKHELHISSCKIISDIIETLPFPLEDANCLYSEKSDRINVTLPIRLDKRYFELRAPFNIAIFKIQSDVVTYFRDYMRLKSFTEIHTPKILGVCSESGASVFELNYFDKSAYLAQSPQLYKQMMINADFEKVYEIGPVFRAENATTQRHLCEFTGMDIEMALLPPFNYHQAIQVLWNGLVYIFDQISLTSRKEIEYIKSIHFFDEMIYKINPVIVTFSDGVELLKEYGFTQCPHEDISTENERELGKIVKRKFESDLFVITEYPESARPFYTKKSDNLGYTKSYDIIMRGQEICSGAQRENDYDTLLAQIKERGLNPELFEDYLNSFKYGSPPHAGGGFGLERILSLYLDLGNIKVASLFPRDPSRITP